MYFTIAELALAVKKSENYIRQHINRKHLSVEREGRNVFVEHNEATRWARERGLSLALPTHVSVAMSRAENRIARMTILTWQTENSNPINLITIVRHRRHETLGPWANEPDQTWSSEAVLTDYASESEGFRLHTLDVPLDQCMELVDLILGNGTLEIAGVEIDYYLESLPRYHWAYRDERRDGEQSFRSPFTAYSAKVTEYWSFTEEPRNRWLEVVETPTSNFERLQGKLGFPISERPDRVGNLVIAGAEDTLHCELSALNKENTLILSVESVDGSELSHNEYTAAVWASHSGDDVARCKLAITRMKTVIDLQSEVDRIGFAVYQNIDGQCIDLMDTYLIMSISGNMHIESGSTLELRDHRRSNTIRLSLGSSRSVIEVDPGKNSVDLDKQIRREVLSRRSVEREVAGRRERNFGRFGPEQFDDAVDFFLGLLRQHTSSQEPIYLADPYFMSIDPGDPESWLYVRLFEATNGLPLQILSSPKKETGLVRPWWSSYPTALISHVTVRELFSPRENETVFHDRYVVTGDGEILMSNSFNGWRKDGVTFVSLPYGVYRAEAEKWWSLNPGLTPDGTLVCEVR